MTTPKQIIHFVSKCQILSPLLNASPRKNTVHTNSGNSGTERCVFKKCSHSSKLRGVDFYRITHRDEDIEDLTVEPPEKHEKSKDDSVRTTVRELLGVFVFFFSFGCLFFFLLNIFNSLFIN